MQIAIHINGIDSYLHIPLWAKIEILYLAILFASTAVGENWRRKINNCRNKYVAGEKKAPQQTYNHIYYASRTNYK